jgi:hypothetical protein
MKHANPYSSLPDFHFWKRAVSNCAPEDFDPVVATTFKIGANTKVATAGSCFAQHIATALQREGLGYFNAEPAHPVVPANLRAESGYGTFSARYGNIYTTRQLLQLFRRAHAGLTGSEVAWRIKEDHYVDPFRPTIQPTGFVSVEDVRADREYHLSRVRYLFANLDCFIFTLGLTESWEGTADGIAYPVCPALFDPAFSEQKYRFVNYRFDDVRADLQAFIDALRSVNPRALIILTVSPVPLVATYEPQHVLCSTTYSKSVLRAVAEEISGSNEKVDYFPSYEIVMGAYNRGRYFEEDLRAVTPAGVAHVMKVFLRHYVEGRAVDAQPIAIDPDESNARDFERFSLAVNKALCDEELLDAQR